MLHVDILQAKVVMINTADATFLRCTVPNRFYVWLCNYDTCKAAAHIIGTLSNVYQVSYQVLCITQP